MSLREPTVEPGGVPCATANKPIVARCQCGDSFGYLTIGSPVPNAGGITEIAEDGTDIARNFPGGDNDAARQCNNSTTFFGSDFKGQQHQVTSADVPDGDHAPDNPTIKVDACRTISKDSMSGHQHHGNSLENVSTVDPSPGTFDCPSMHSSLHGGQQLFLNPTPPLGRKSVVNSRTVIYYAPSMTCSKSESSLVETTADGPCGVAVPEYDPVGGLVPAHSMSVLRSPSKAEVSVANRNVLLSPISFRKDRQSATNLSGNVTDICGDVRCTCTCGKADVVGGVPP